MKILLQYHPHANTALFKKDQIDLFMQNTDPEYVFLCMDTAHTTLAGIDAVEFAKEILENRFRQILAKQEAYEIVRQEAEKCENQILYLLLYCFELQHGMYQK